MLLFQEKYSDEKINTKNSLFYEPTESAPQVSDDYVTSENNLEPTVSTVTTYIDTIIYYDVNNDGPSWTEEI